MACTKFETTGLLYLSGELNQNEARSYESHLAECAECNREIDDYKNERASFYTAEILGDAPSPQVDAEILRVCSKPVKVVATALSPMMFIRKYAAAPIFLMLIMVAIGGYVRYHSMSAQNLSAELVKEASQENAVAMPENRNAYNDADDEFARNDSLTDETPRREGNLEMPGVVTVSGE